MSYTLRNITDCLYFKKNSKNIELENLDDSEKEERLQTYYNSKSRNFTEIIHILDLDKEINYLKTNKNGNFSFGEEDKEFFVELLSEYSNKLDPLRRGDFSNVNFEYLEWIYENIIKVFQRNNVGKDEIRNIALKMNNRLNYPLIKSKNSILKFEQRLINLLNKAFSCKSLPLNRMDLYTWLEAFEQDYKAMINQWCSIINRMSEIRECELLDLAEEDSYKMNEDEEIKANIDWIISGKLMKRLESDEEYISLQKQYNELIGNQNEKEYKSEKDEFNNIHENNLRKKPYIKKVENKLEKVAEDMKKRYDKIYFSIVKETFPNYEISCIEDKKQDFSELCSSKQLLEKAINELKEDIEFDKKIKEERINIDLPDIDFEDIRKNLENICSLGINK